jgi:GNAT superfamily N-acetyltransferase
LPIEVMDAIPKSDELWSLFLTTGWNEEYGLSPTELRSAFEASWRCVAAYEDGRLVGIGRVVSDRIVHAMIYDLIVVPDRQGAGIGAQLLERLVGCCKQAKIRDVQLFCATGKRAFYERHGFAARLEDAPGMQYVGPAAGPSPPS